MISHEEVIIAGVIVKVTVYDPLFNISYKQGSVDAYFSLTRAKRVSGARRISKIRALMPVCHDIIFLESSWKLCLYH